MIYHLVIGTRTLVVHKPDGPCESLSKYKWQLEHRSKTPNRAAIAEQDVQTLWDTKSPLAIAFTCRQIYHEAVEIWYANNRFFFYSLPCMAVFLAEIGPTSRNSIRYIEYDRKWDSLNKQAPDVKQLICTHLVGLRQLTLRWDYYSRTENQWSFCEEDAHELLKLRDQLEVVILWKMHVTHIVERYPIPCQIGTVESLELKRDKGTGRIVTTSLTIRGCLRYRIPAGACGYDEEEDEKWFPKWFRIAQEPLSLGDPVGSGA
jgi:hypothetical protein